MCDVVWVGAGRRLIKNELTHVCFTVDITYTYFHTHTDQYFVKVLPGFAETWSRRGKLSWYSSVPVVY